MFHPTLKLSEIVENYRYKNTYFDIVQVGTGGNGGYLVQRLSKLLYALSTSKEGFRFSYTLVDGDRVEDSNLQRQPFIDGDVLEPKAKVLAERYEAAYDFPIMYRDSYIESKVDLINCFNPQVGFHQQHIPILIGCVDNNASRQIMHELFEELPNVIYIDSGIDSVDIEASEEEKVDTGYSGQVVCGVKMHHHLYLEPVGRVYSNILEDKDSRLPTQACGETVLYYPQRMQTNEAAALIMNGYLNTLLGDSEIVSHYTNFNARTMMTRPVYLNKEQTTNKKVKFHV